MRKKIFMQKTKGLRWGVPLLVSGSFLHCVADDLLRRERLTLSECVVRERRTGCRRGGCTGGRYGRT